MGRGGWEVPENRCSSTLRPPGPSEIPNCRHRGSAKKGPPSPLKLPIVLLVFPFLLSELGQSYRSVYWTRVISKRRLGRRDSTLVQCSWFIWGVTLPSLLPTLLVALHTHHFNSPTPPPVQRQGEDFSSAKPARVSLGDSP